jgi:DNA-binding response OmpR family regulator
LSAPSDLESWIQSAQILVVDDQDAWVRMVSAVLSSWGARPVGADSVARAEILMAQRGIDMVISDLIMPDQDGLALIRWIRHHPNKVIQRTPVALITSETSVLNINRARCCGADMVIEKPLKPDVLWQRMAAVIARGSAAAHATPPCAKVLAAPCPLIPVRPTKPEPREADGQDQATARVGLAE